MLYAMIRPSNPPTTKLLPSALMAALLIAEVRTTAGRLLVLQIRAVLSSDDVTIRLPSALKLALNTLRSCPFNEKSRVRFLASHMATLSADAVTMRRPSGLNAALDTDLGWRG